MDILEALRTAIKAGNAIEEDGDAVIIEGKRWNKSEKTPYHSVRGKGDFLSLEALWFFGLHLEKSHIDYTKLCTAKGVDKINYVDREDIINYLTGKIDDVSSIDRAGFLQKIGGSSIATQKKGSATEGALDNAAATMAGGAAGIGSVGEERRIMDAQDDDELKKVLKKERPTRTRISMFLSRNEKNFQEMLDLFQSSSRDKQGRMDPRRHGGASEVANPKMNAKKAKIAGSGGRPIIIVPTGMSSLLNMANAAKLFEQETYEDPSKARQTPGYRSQDRVIVSRVDGRRGVPPKEYEVTDNVARLSASEWDRVVAVFVQGPAWQFKDYKWKDVSEVFEHARAFYLCFVGQKKHANIANWNVVSLEINEHRRHMDKAAMGDFWEELDRFVAAKKPELAML